MGMKLLSLTVCVLLLAAVSRTHNKEKREKNKERKEKKGRKEKKNDDGGTRNNRGGCGIQYYTVQETQYQTSCSNTYKTQCSTSYKSICNQVPTTTIQNQCTQQHIQEPAKSICTNEIIEVNCVVGGKQQKCYQDHGQQSRSQSAGSTKVVQNCTPVQQTSHRHECRQSPQNVCNQVPSKTCSQQPVAVNKQVARRVCY